jgi:hypothetical protein
MSGPTEPSSQTPLTQTPLTWMLIGTVFYLFCNRFLPWHTPILQSGEQVYFWMDAQRMLHGERAYVDFFQYTPPGTDLFFLTLFKLMRCRDRVPARKQSAPRFSTGSCPLPLHLRVFGRPPHDTVDARQIHSGNALQFVCEMEVWIILVLFVLLFRG